MERRLPHLSADPGGRRLLDARDRLRADAYELPAQDRELTSAVSLVTSKKSRLRRRFVLCGGPSTLKNRAAGRFDDFDMSFGRSG